MRRYFTGQKKSLKNLFIALAFILLARLFYLTVIDSDKWKNAANNLSIRGIYNSSPRGNIYDRNGKVLATNTQIFSVKMSAGDMDNDDLNKVALNLLNLLEANGDKYELDFPLVYENGSYQYKFDIEKRQWLAENGFDSSITAEEAFYALKNKLGIESEDRYEIEEQLYSKYSIYPPILVKNMVYKTDEEKKTFLNSYGIENSKTTAEKAVKQIRKKFEIDSSLSDEDAMKVMAVRNTLRALGYKRYMPATIAKSVSQKTVIDIEESKDRLKGVEISSESKRVYPNGNLASHILGYMGQISAGEKSEYEKKGYEASNQIGKEGIEGKYESILKGQPGTDIIMVNADGSYAGDVKKIEGKKGKDIYLTIDLELQKVAQEALKKNIEVAKTGGTFTSEFGNVSMSAAAPKAKTGAIVAIEVKTGDVLAMASYPDYDPNLFVDGISSENWKSLQSQNPRDSLEAAPMLNLATMSAVQPGSIFKLVTAMAALQAGLDPNRKLKDNGAIELGDRYFACVAWNLYRGNHGYVDMYKAIEVSCNYYFFDLITNKDWATGSSLGLSDMNIDSVLNMAKNFGLDEKTGIELSEVAYGVPSEKGKVEGLKAMLRNILHANAEAYFTSDVYSNSKRLEKDINTIVDWMDVKDMSYTKMKNEYLPEVGVKKDKYEDIIQLCLYDYFNQAKWSDGDAFNISIGQGDNAYTPLQMANYMATLGNYGVKNQVSIVKSIEDEGDNTKKTPEDKKLNKKQIQQVIEGMNRVTNGSDSGLTYHYRNFPWEVAAKTGTAQKFGTISPKSEVEYIKSNLSRLGNLSWSDVEAEMKRLMKQYPKTYTSEDIAVRKAVVNVSDNKVTYADIDSFKDTYDEFSWAVALAPKDDPKIAVVCMIPQGVWGANANPAVREVIGQYLKGINKEYSDFRIVENLN